MLQVTIERKKDQHKPNPWLITFEENTRVGKQMDFLFCFVQKCVGFLKKNKKYIHYIYIKTTKYIYNNICIKNTPNIYTLIFI